MITENLSTLKIHKLTQAQYDRELEAGRIDENALYLTPDEEVDIPTPIVEDEGKVLTVADGVPEWQGATMTKYVDITEEQLTQGYIDINGATSNNNSWLKTDYVPLDYVKNEPITVYCTIYVNGGIAFYDADKTLLLGVVGSNAAEYGITASYQAQQISITPPENAAFIRISQFLWDGQNPSFVWMKGISETTLSETFDSKADKRYPLLDAGKHLTVGSDGNVRAGEGNFAIIRETTTAEAVGKILFDGLAEQKIFIEATIPVDESGSDKPGIVCINGSATLYNGAMCRSGATRRLFVMVGITGGRLFVDSAQIHNYTTYTSQYTGDWWNYAFAGGGSAVESIHSVDIRLTGENTFPIGTNLKVYAPREG